MAPSASSPTSACRQRGASLIVTLVVLVALMILGVATYVASTTQFRMAGNLQFQNVAMSNAENALAQAEAWIATNSLNNGFSARVSGGLYPKGTAPDPLTMAWNDTTSVSVDALGTQRYMVELLADNRVLPANSVAGCNVYGSNGPCPKVNVFRVTTRGISILGTTQFTQSVFAVRALSP